MKRMTLFLLSALLIGCSPGIEDDARGRLSDMMKDLEVKSMDTEYVSDSICILTFVINEDNEFGGKTLNRYEYILRQYDDSRMEALRPINNEMTMLERSKNGIAGYNEEGYEPNLRFSVGLYLMENGREVRDGDK